VTPLTFAVFSDVNNSASGDTPLPIFTNVINSIKSNVNSYAVFPGDALIDSTTNFLNRWDIYLAKENPLGLPLYRVPGDNDRVDVTDGLNAWNTKIGKPIYYTQDIGDIHYIFIANAYAGHVGWIGYNSETDPNNSQEAKDLVADLHNQSSKQGPKTIVVVQHYPLINGKTDKPYAGSKLAEANALKDLFNKYGVDLVIAADTHVYRSMIVDNVPYLQNLPAASTPRTIGVYATLPACQSGETCDSGYNGYLTVTLNNDRSLTVNRYKVVSGSDNRTLMGSVKFNDRP
jgi:Icc-related predicted phosphoesterase